MTMLKIFGMTAIGGLAVLVGGMVLSHGATNPALKGGACLLWIDNEVCQSAAEDVGMVVPCESSAMKLG